jgi:hypothetical protein
MKNKRLKLFVLPVFALLVLFSGCDYGQLGGADQTDAFMPGDQRFESIMSSLSGVWYSHYAGVGRLDGYRIGKLSAFNNIVGGKTALFPKISTTYATYYTNSTSTGNDYFVLYDDTVYGQQEDGTGANGGWDGPTTRYIGIVRAINIFNGNPARGALIIEYIKGCAPQWDPDIKDGQRPFFGVYYRVLDSNTIQMANAVDLAALSNGEKYYTETATLEEAIAKNNVMNEAEYISWGVTIPQDREK